MSDEKKQPPPTYEESEGAPGPSRVNPSAPSINAACGYDDIMAKVITSDGMPKHPPTPSGVAPPPSAPPLGATAAIPRPSLMHLVSLTDAQLREALSRYVEDYCCYGTRFIRDMILTEIFNGCIFHYKLETFGEKRQSNGTYESYRGQEIDGPENGTPPAPWDMTVRDPTMFKDDYTYKEIPHTGEVKTCYNCSGTGIVKCSSCYGDGYKECWRCNGKGKDSDDERCYNCSGDGRERCSRCDGRGRVECSTCDGHGKLRHYQSLKVTWKNHVENFVSDSMSLPKELVMEVSGKEIFKEEDLQVQPISHSPDQKINAASEYIIGKHANAFRDELIRRQRQTLRGVPMTRAYYIWKKTKGEFYVYGYQRKVYFEDYPQQCCCCTCC